MKTKLCFVGLLVAVLAVGCDTAVKDVKKAAEKAAKEAEAKVKETGDEAKAAVEEAGKEAKSAVEGAIKDAAGSVKVGDVDVTKEFTSLAEGLNTTLAGIKDVDSAKAALPKLEEANLGLDKLLGLFDQIPEAARPAVAGLVKTHASKITETIQNVVKIEGVGEIVKPVLDQIVEKLSKTP